MAGESKSLNQLEILYYEIMKKLTNNGLYLVLFYGTLLGYIRDKNFINGDDDIDVLMPRYQLPKLMNIIKKENIQTGIVTNDIVQLYFNDLGPFDIYLFENKESDILIRWDGNYLHSHNHFYPLYRIKFKGYQVYIPKNSESLLTEIYNNWRTPQIKGSYLLPEARRMPVESFINSINYKSYFNLIIIILILGFMVIIILPQR